jgi:hypothetical protein
MTLKSKKVYENHQNNKKNIRTKQHGGSSKYTVVGHDKNVLGDDGKLDPNTGTKSDLYTDASGNKKYLLSKYDLSVVNKFLENAKGKESEFYEYGMEGTNETNFNKFIQDLTTITSGSGSGAPSLLVSSDGTKTPTRTTDKKNVEINTAFLRNLLKKMSTSEENLKLGDTKDDLLRDDNDKPKGTILGKTGDPTIQQATRESLKVTNNKEVSNIGTLLTDLRTIYNKYHDTYKKQSDSENFATSFFFEKDGTNSSLTEAIASQAGKKTMFETKKAKEDKDINRFKTLSSIDDTGESYYFSTESEKADIDSKDDSFLKHEFDKFNFDGLKDYSVERKSQNIQGLGNLGIGVVKKIIEKDSKTTIGNFGFDVIDINSQEIKDRYEWCYLMERLYLFKHMELLQLVINITYIINSLFIMYYLFSRIVKLREVEDQKCPIPRQVVLPPTYRQLIQNYFNTQRGDLIHINSQIKDTVVGIQKVLNSSMGITDSKNPYQSVNGVPNEYRNYAVSSDFLNRPLTFASYNHLIKSQRLFIPTIYLFDSSKDFIITNKEKLTKYLVNLYPDAEYRKHLVINVSADTRVYRSRIAEQTSQVDTSTTDKQKFTDKFRYKIADHIPLKITISKASSYADIVTFFERLQSQKTIPAAATNNSEITLDSDIAELSYVQYKQDLDSLTNHKNQYYDGDDGVIALSNSNYYSKEKDIKVDATGKLKPGPASFKEIGAGTGKFTPIDIDKIITGDYKDTISLIVNLKKIPDIDNDIINKLLEVLKKNANQSLSSVPLLDIVYFNIYKNQLKIVLGVPEGITKENITQIRTNIENFRAVIFTDEFEQQDQTRNIIFTTLKTQTQAGGAQNDIQRPIFDQDTGTDSFYGRAETIYDSDQVPKDDRDYYDSSFKYRYKKGTAYKIPYSINEKQLDTFMDELGSSENLNPLKLASSNDIYKKFRIENRDQIDNYINQYKNIKELVLDSNTNNSQLKNMIEFLNNPEKKTLYDFNQQVMKKNMKITGLQKDAGRVKVSVKGHGLDKGVMVTINGTGTNLDNRSFEVFQGAADNTDYFTINVAGFEGTFNSNTNNATATAYSDDYDIHSMNILQSKFEEENDGYSPKHVQLYLNRCYELEKLYIIKHHEFLFMKNIFDKSFIFYLMTFIVFFYYIKTLGRIEKKSCNDTQLKLPKTFLGDIELMVKNQNVMLNNINDSKGSFNILKKIGSEAEGPNFILSGGSSSPAKSVQPVKTNLLNNIPNSILAWPQILTFIGETDLEYENLTLQLIHTKLKQNNDPTYDAAREYLNLMGKSKRKEETTQYSDPDYLKKFLEGVCVSDSIISSRSPALQLACKNKITLKINEALKNLVSELKDKNLSQDSINLLEDQLQKIQPLKADEAGLDSALKQIMNGKGSFKEKQDKINQLYNLDKGSSLSKVVLNQDRSDIINMILENEKNKILKDPNDRSTINVISDGSFYIFSIVKQGSKKEIKISHAELKEFMNIEVTIVTSTDGKTTPTFTFTKPNENKDISAAHKTLFFEELNSKVDLIKKKKVISEIFKSLIKLDKMVNEYTYLVPANPASTEADKILTSYKYYFDLIRKNIFEIKEEVITVDSFESNSNIYDTNYVQKITQPEIADLINSLTTQKVADCLTNMEPIISKIKEKKESLSKIDKYFSDDATPADKNNFYNLINDFFEPNFKLVSIFGEGEDDDIKKDNLFETKTMNKKNLMIALINAYYGDDKGILNNTIVKDIEGSNDDKELGQKMLNMYKNYMEFRRMTCAFVPGDGNSDGNETEVQNQRDNASGPNYSEEGDQPKYTTLKNQDKLKETIQPMAPANPNKVSRSNYLSKQIISEFQKDKDGGGGKQIFEIFNKYFFQEITKFEFTLYHYNVINKILKNQSGAPKEIDEVGLSCKTEARFLINQDDQIALKVLEVKDEEKRTVDGVDVSINGLMSTFNEKMMGAARVYTLIRDTADKKFPPFMYYKPLPKIKYNGKIVEKITDTSGKEVDYRSEDINGLKAIFTNTTEYKIKTEDGEVTAKGTEIQGKLEFVDLGDESRIQLTTGGGPGGRIIKTHSEIENPGSNPDKKEFVQFLKEKIDKFENDVQKTKSKKTEDILKYRAVGDLFLHPLSDQPEIEGEINDNPEKTQNFESTCVFMPNKNFLGIGAEDSKFHPYPCSDEWNSQESFGKVYGPFRKTAFHSVPSKLYKQEFKDISTDIETGSAAVFFGYGFSGSGKTYTLTNERDGFLKTIVKELKAKGKDITKVYIKELYPYFPNHLEPEILDERTANNNYENWTKCKPNVKRMREPNAKYDSKTGRGPSLGTDEEVLTYVPDISDSSVNLYSKNDNTLSKDGNIYPFVEIDYLTITGDTEEKIKAKNMKVLGDSNDTNTIPTLTQINSSPDKELPKLINTVAKIRKQLLQVSATPNNPDSSRSHLYIQLEFTDGGSLTIVDMAGAENTIQIQVQFLIGENSPKFTTEEKLILTPRIKNTQKNWLSLTDVEVTPISEANKAAKAIWQPKDSTARKKYNKKSKQWDTVPQDQIIHIKYGYDIDGHETTTDGDPDWRNHSDAKKLSVSSFFELIYKAIGKDTLGIPISGNNQKAYGGKQNIYICGIPMGEVNIESLNTIFPSLNKQNKIGNDKFNLNIPFNQRFIHYGEKCGSNGSNVDNLFNTFIVFTIYDIALALNYKPIGITNLYQEWKTGNLYRDTNEINISSLPSLIKTFEGKIWTSMWKSGNVKGEDRPDNSFDGVKFDEEAKKTSKGDNLNYNRIFANFVIPTEPTEELDTYSKECVLILKKILVQLDLEYLIDPRTILAYAKTKEYTDPNNCIIYSPFVWLYYRCKEIIGDNDLIKKILILKIIFQYINLIVDQGKGIVTSLEHLKYFFLYNTNQQEGLYAYNFKQVDPKVRFLHNSPIPPPDFETWIDNDPDNRNTYVKIANQNNGYSNKDYISCDLLTDSSKYKRPVFLEIDGKQETIIEEVNKGNIERFKMLQNLVYFGKVCNKPEYNQCKINNNEKTLNDSILFTNYKSKPYSQLTKYPYIRFLKDTEEKKGSKYYEANKSIEELTTDKKEKKKNKQTQQAHTLGYETFKVLDINSGFIEPGAVQKDNTYIMMAHIMRGVFDSDGYVNKSDRGKYCDATKATLEFAESIKSDVGICKPIKAAIIDNQKNRWNYQATINAGNCDNIYNISSRNPVDVVNKLQSGGDGTMVCSYTSPENTNKIYELSLPSYLRNNNRNMAVHTMVDMLTNKIRSKRNTVSIANRLRSKRKSLKSPSRFLVRHYKR